jgi:uncharacterized RDD family membrane protein YckC
MASPNIPDPLRDRLLRQSRRVRLVRISFALTIAAALVVSFGVALFQGVAPSVRATELVLVKGGEKPQGLVLDQTYDPSTVRGEIEGSFRLAWLRDGEVVPGATFRGVAGGVTLAGENRAIVVFESHFIEFDTSGTPKDSGWPKTVRQQNLGINDNDASPTVAMFDGKPWLCWLAGQEARLRPLDNPDVQSALLQGELRKGALMRMISAEGYLWLIIMEKHTGALKLLWFKPRLDEVLPQPGDGVKEEGNVVANIEGLHSSDITKDARGFALTMFKGQPVVMVARREKDKQADTWELWRLKSDGWGRETLPEFPSNALLIAMSDASLSAVDDTLAVVYSDGRTAHMALGKLENGALVFGEPTTLGLGDARGLGPMLIWVGVMLGLFMLLAGQGLWLLLNRSQELDKTLAAVLSDKSPKAAPLPKSETMLHATLLARAIALLVDLGVTSPAVIMLKSVYGYEWTQAYGFLLPVGIVTEVPVLLATLQASVVTLSILTLYAMVCELLWGRTFGKALLHLRVVDSEGEQPSAWQIVVRNFVRVFEIAHWAVFLIPALLMMMGGKQQRLGDMLGRTYVIVEVVPEDQADDLEI